MKLFANSLSHFLSLSILFRPTCKANSRASVCTLFLSFITTCFFLLLYNHCKAFLKLRPPVYFDPLLVKFCIFLPTHCLLEPPSFIWHLIVGLYRIYSRELKSQRSNAFRSEEHELGSTPRVGHHWGQAGVL